MFVESGECADDLCSDAGFSLLQGLETMDSNCCKRAECALKFTNCTNIFVPR